MSEKNAARQLRIAHNKAQIIEALKAVGITFATVEYTGEGDDGNGYDLSYTPADKIQPGVTIRSVKSEFVEGKWAYTEADKTDSMDSALGEFLDDLITQNGHDGYENGEGGGGTLTIDVEANAYELAHYDNIVKQEYSNHEG